MESHIKHKLQNTPTTQHYVHYPTMRKNHQTTNHTTNQTTYTPPTHIPTMRQTNELQEKTMVTYHQFF
jgi:hypothetical protein